MVPLADYPHAVETQTLAEAVTLLETSEIGIGGRVSMPRILLVIDDDNQLLGMVRRRDILRGLQPRFHDALDKSHPEAHFKTEIDPNLTDLVAPDADRLKRKLAKPLSDVVIEFPAQVSADDSLNKVVRRLVGNDTHIAAVLEDGHVIGVVRSLDVLHAATEGMI